MGLFGGLFKKLGQIVSGQKIDDEFFDELEEQLILADMGVETAMELVENLRRDARKPVSYTHLDVYKRQPLGCGERRRRETGALVAGYNILVSEERA